MSKMSLGDLVEDDGSESSDSPVDEIPVDDQDEDGDVLDWDDFYNELSDAKLNEYRDVIMKRGEGELRDLLISEFGLINDPDPFIIELRRDLRENASDDVDDSLLNKGGSYEERKIEGEHGVMKEVNVRDDGDGDDSDSDTDEEHDNVSSDGGQVTEEFVNDEVDEVISMLRDDGLGSVPKNVVKKELSRENFEKLKNCDGIEVDKYNVSWVGG